MRHPCLNCLTPNTVALKLDKKGRPYSSCTMCGTRAFIKTRIGLRGFIVLAPQVMALWEQATTAVDIVGSADREASNALATGSMFSTDEGKVAF